MSRVVRVHLDACDKELVARAGEVVPALDPGFNDYDLRQVAAQLHDVIKQAPGVSEVKIFGRRRRQLRVTLDAGRLSSFGLARLQVMGALGSANSKLPAGSASAGNAETVIEAGSFLRDAEDAKNVAVAVSGGHAVYEREVASVGDTGVEPSQYVQFASGESFEPAVTISVAKRKGTTAITVAVDVLRKMDAV